MQYLPNRSDEPEDIVLQNLERINAARWLCMLPTASNPPTKVFNFYLSARLGCLTESTIQGADIPEPRVNEIRRDEIHYDKIRCWIDDCMSSHLGNCTKRVELPVHHLNLIDCESRCIITAKPSFRYSALSYVWGLSPDGTGTIRGNGLPSSIPKTIEDAMVVNGQLGIRYLWVDRYCILDSSDHKAEQIGNMHNIYRGAEVTIIAAAGEDPHYGLPGVHQRRPRKSQPAFDFKGRRLVFTGRSLPLHLQYSKWDTRAWTLQEGLLSRRRLVFTDEQVYFECQNSQYCEMVDLSAGREKEILGMGYTRFEAMSLDPLIRHDYLQWSIWNVIRKYTSRQLTHDSDVLNAMLGILAYFEEQRPQEFRHMWGLPIILKDGKCLHEVLIHSLMWTGKDPARRRPEFPSWSWIGWTGKARMCEGDVDIIPVEIQFELRDGSFISSSDELKDMQQYKVASQNISHFLIIKAPTVNIRICPGQQSGLNPPRASLDSRWEATLVHPDEGRLAQPLPSDQSNVNIGRFFNNESGHDNAQLDKKFSSSSVWKAILLGHGPLTKNSKLPERILVVHKVGTWWERVGIAEFNCSKEVMHDHVKSYESFRLG